MSDARQETFDSLRTIMSAHADALVLVNDSATDYYLNTAHIMKNKKPLFFGAVQVKKNYISYHLMPVYVNPSLLDSISGALRKRMQGKSCFNFKSIDTPLLDELATLTAAGLDFYRAEGYVAA